MIFKITVIVIAAACMLFAPHAIFAQEKPTVTIVNPIRGPQLGLEKADLLASFRSQWQATKDATASATWLWQYSALENQSLIKIAQTEMKDQEHGIFLEIDNNTAQKSGVDFKGRNQWYHSDGLLLVSYDLYERRRIIDTTFSKFKSIFGYYPQSVGAWWVGADAIKYMKEKYNITAVLQCTDQFSTDAYSIWGTPWSIPYIPRKDNAGVPALKSEDNNVVMMQWAARDPTRGYGDAVEHSTYSMQDYQNKGYDLKYIEYLNSIYLKKPGDQLVFGLEGGLSPEGYNAYSKQVAQTKTWERQGKLKIQTMKDFAQSFLKLKRPLPKTNYFLAKDYENNDQSFWYNSPYYRAALIKKDKKISLIDLRDYINTPEEDFNKVPNTQSLLRINTSSFIDSVRFPQSKADLTDSEKPLTIIEQKDKVSLKTGDRIIAEFWQNRANINGTSYIFTKKGTNPQIKSWQDEVQWQLEKERLSLDYQQLKESLFSSKKKIVLLSFFVYLFLGVLVTIIVLFYQRNTKTALVLTFIVISFPAYLLFIKYTSPPNIVLTNYEAEALQAAVKTNKNITYLSPKSDLLFRAVQPLLFAKPSFAEKLTQKKWNYINRNEGTALEAQLPNNTILIVPRYLGQTIYPEEVPRLGLRKIFDNAQIALYTNN